MAERRKHKRVTFYTEANYGYPGKITDISVNGAFIENLTPLPEKSFIVVKFKLPKGKELLLKAIVKNSMQGMGMGIEFVHEKAEDKQALIDFINFAL